MNHHYNPYHVHGGVFVPHYLLSSGEISPGAKLVYALLAQSADRRGEALLNVQLLAAEMGEREEQVFRFMNELDVARLVRTQRHPAGTEFVRCFFNRPAWIEEGRQSGENNSVGPSTSKKFDATAASVAEFTLSQQHASRGGVRRQRRRHDQSQPQSRFSRETCVNYALACRQAGQPIHNPFAFANKIYTTGEQDAEIAFWQESERPQAQVA
jgi:hypothetical protein